MVDGLRPRGLVALLGVLAALSVLPACGSAGPLSVAQYRRRANAICAHLYGARPPATTPVKKLEWAVGQSRTALTALKALRPPPSLAKLHEQVVRVDTRLDAFTSSLVKQVKAGYITVAGAAAAYETSPVSNGKTETALWKKLGVKVCAEGPTAYLAQHGG